MAAVNFRRVLVGGIAGGLAWTIWSMVIGLTMLAKRYTELQGTVFLKEPRYPFFTGLWIITLFLMAYVCAWLYASARATRGAGPGTALRIGVMVGFMAGFPNALAIATWGNYTPIIPLGQMLEMWVGAILATFVAGWLYRD